MGSRAAHRSALFQPLPDPALAPPRLVGVEVEFMGPTARRAAQALAAGVGGDVVAEDAHAFAVRGSDLGDLAVELDLRYAHPQRHGMTLPVRIGPKAAAGLGWLVSGAVPRELIVPPLPVDRLAEVDRILGLLRAAGAHGRGATVFGSLGLHFNIDAPAADLPRITAVMLAFGLMELRLRREIAQGQPRLARHRRRPTRRSSCTGSRRPGTGPARPDWSTTTWPPTRRATAAWTCCRCCWGWTRRGVRSCPMRNIAARPVFHFRLPQAHPSESGWSIVADWNRWVAVERLAADGERLAAAARAYRAGEAAWGDGRGPSADAIT